MTEVIDKSESWKDPDAAYANTQESYAQVLVEKPLPKDDSVEITEEMVAKIIAEKLCWRLATDSVAQQMAYTNTPKIKMTNERRTVETRELGPDHVELVAEGTWAMLCFGDKPIQSAF
jgi:hypothetical protein